MIVPKEELEKMQEAAEAPGLYYWTTVDAVANEDMDSRVIVEFSGFADNDHAMWFGRYISLLLSLNNMVHHPDFIH